MPTSRSRRQRHRQRYPPSTTHRTNPHFQQGPPLQTATTGTGTATAGSSSSTYHSHKPQTHSHSHTSSSPSSSSELSAVSYETMDRRHSAAVNLESWELLAMHSIASDESIPRVRLRLLKSLAGLPTDDVVASSGGQTGGGSAISSPPGSLRRSGGGVGSGGSGGGGGGGGVGQGISVGIRG